MHLVEGAESRSTRKNEPKGAAVKKKEFEIDVVMARLEEAVASYPPAALFQLADEGYDSPFEQLLACIISIRTRDEMTVPLARRFFDQARTPKAVAALTEDEIEELIRPSTFHGRKAGQIQAIAQRVMKEHGGKLPCDEKTLLAFQGVGPKCANLTLGIGCGQPRISVDVHVHRVTNRWGYVDTVQPEQTAKALGAKLPERYWLAINRLLVPFGKHICVGRLPLCTTCPLLEMCKQVGLGAFR
jgi:endonuclease-3